MEKKNEIIEFNCSRLLNFLTNSINDLQRGKISHHSSQLVKHMKIDPFGPFEYLSHRRTNKDCQSILFPFRLVSHLLDEIFSWIVEFMPENSSHLPHVSTWLIKYFIPFFHFSFCFSFCFSISLLKKLIPRKSLFSLCLIFISFHYWIRMVISMLKPKFE